MSKTRRLVLIALFSSFLGIFSQLALPSPTGIPFTFQTFAVALCGCLLGWASGSISVLVWLTLGAVGVPLFSGFRGGVAVLLGPTGGFLIGFLCLVLFCGIARGNSVWKICFFGLIGLILCHLLGILWFCVVSDRNFFVSALSLSLPYLWKDLLSLVGAVFCSRGMLRILPFLQKI